MIYIWMAKYVIYFRTSWKSNMCVAFLADICPQKYRLGFQFRIGFNFSPFLKSLATSVLNDAIRISGQEHGLMILHS